MIITGRSGSGKTTLLNLVAGLTTPSSGAGAVRRGRPLEPLRQGAVPASGTATVGFVFQFPSLLPHLTVLENVVLPTSFGRGHGKPARPMQGRGAARAGGPRGQAAGYPRQLSAGQQQRVVLARSLVNRPGLILADEPSSNLDERTEAEIMDLFSEVHRETGVTIVMVTHTSQLLAYGTRSIEMAAGRIVSDDPGPAEGASAPQSHARI